MGASPLTRKDWPVWINLSDLSAFFMATPFSHWNSAFRYLTMAWREAPLWSCTERMATMTCVLSLHDVLSRAREASWQTRRIDGVLFVRKSSTSIDGETRLCATPTPSMRRPWLPLTQRTLPHTLSSTVFAICNCASEDGSAARLSKSDRFPTISL